MKHVLIKQLLCSFWLNIFTLETQGQGLPTARERERQRANERERERAGERRQCFFLFSLPAVNLVGFSVTFIREGDLVHLKRQMKELEANYQEIEKR